MPQGKTKRRKCSGLPGSSMLSEQLASRCRDEGDLPVQVWCPDRHQSSSPEHRPGDRVRSRSDRVPHPAGLYVETHCSSWVGTAPLHLVCSPLCVVCRRIPSVCSMWIETTTSTRPKAQAMVRLTGWAWRTRCPFLGHSMRLPMCWGLRPLLEAKVRLHGWASTTDLRPNGSELKPDASSCK